MIIKFWGTRGSLPVPGPDTVRYGGNTTCISVQTNDGQLLVLDAGTGIRPLGEQLSRHPPVRCTLFISHTHWDHIHGLPFFSPLFSTENRIEIYGAPDPVSKKSIRSLLANQMEYPHFPVRINELSAQIEYRDLEQGKSIQVGSATVSTVQMHHTAMTHGFKVEDGGRSLFFTSDHEPYRNYYPPGDEQYDEYQRIVDGQNAKLRRMIQGVDLLIADSQYTTEEYPSHRGWGHSTHDHSVGLALDVGARSLFMTHHEITRRDDELDQTLEQLRRQHADTELEIQMASEGLEVVL